ncbi:hypothetical protein HDK64DRAFT_283194, partial [Phyllosticta capitalensis]
MDECKTCSPRTLHFAFRSATEQVTWLTYKAKAQAQAYARGQGMWPADARASAKSTNAAADKPGSQRRRRDGIGDWMSSPGLLRRSPLLLRSARVGRHKSKRHRCSLGRHGRWAWPRLALVLACVDAARSAPPLSPVLVTRAVRYGADQREPGSWQGDGNRCGSYPGADGRALVLFGVLVLKDPPDDCSAGELRVDGSVDRDVQQGSGKGVEK